MRLDYELTRKWILEQTRMQNCKEYVQKRAKIFVVIWHTFPVLLIIFSYIPVHTYTHARMHTLLLI